MKLTEIIIKNMTSEEYMKNRSQIREFYKNKKQSKKDYDKSRYKKKIIYEVTGKNNKKKVYLSEKATLLRMHTDGKECKECLDFKKWDDFYQNIQYQDGKSHICKNCTRQRYNLKYNIDINFKLSQTLRKRVYHALKGNRKSDTTKNLVGCSIENLKKHLQSKFEDDMTWENYGKWHVDHIIPCAKFDLSKPEEQRKCFHYSNLQPLWAIDNITKGCKILKK